MKVPHQQLPTIFSALPFAIGISISLCEELSDPRIRKVLHGSVLLPEWQCSCTVKQDKLASQ